MSDGGAFEVEADFAFLGRTFEEYRRMFALELTDLTRGPILDCPGGPSAFASVASQFAPDVTAVDPMYGPVASELEAECSAAVECNVEQLREKRDLFVWEFYGDVETRGRYQRAAYERFLADYARNPNRYVEAALPDLPFESDAFALALSANFLFLYDDRLDYEFHVAALRELLRVAREEVRVFTLASLDRRRSAYVAPVTETLRDDGFAVEFRSVPYEFQPGATEMLVVSDPDRTGVTR